MIYIDIASALICRTVKDLAAYASDLYNHTVLPSHARVYWERDMSTDAIQEAVDAIGRDIEVEIKEAHALCQTLNTYRGDNVWQDVLMPYIAPDRDQIDDSSGTVAVLTCGTIVEFYEYQNRWLVRQGR